MISHCLPDATGCRDRARAWQLLRQARRQHDVSLICLHDGQMDLAQWRAVQRHVDRLAIEQATLTRYLIDRRNRHVDPTVETWQEQIGFDAVLFTHPALWSSAILAEADVFVGDSAHRSLPRRPRQQRRDAQLVEQAADICDLMLTDQPGHNTFDARAVVTPVEIDLDHYPTNEDRSATVVIHGHRQTLSGRTARQWARRIADLEWMTTRSMDRRDVAPALAGATVVAVPDLDAWSALQALACGRPVITSSAVAQRLGAHHGEHLLIADDPHAFAARCRELLEDSQLHWQLSMGGRALAQAHRLRPDQAAWTALLQTPSSLAAAA